MFFLIMTSEELLLIYKYLILLNANKQGWELLKKDNKSYILRKVKADGEIFDLESDISLFLEKPYNVKDILSYFNKIN